MIQILCADTAGADEALYLQLYAQASPARRIRADRYRRREDALRCVTADALLRHALGTEQYTVVQEKGGKPRIPERPDFHYNLSHAGRWVVLAWGDTEVGVDVQEQDPAVDRCALAMHFFTPDERDYAGEDIGRFYEIWTKKESYLKYTGRGLRTDLRSFSVLSERREVRFFSRTLDGDHSLSLCTEEDDYGFALLDIQRLLS